MIEAKHVEEKKRSYWPIMMVLLVGIGLALGYWIYHQQVSAKQLNEQILHAREELETATAHLEELQAQLDREIETNTELESQLKEAQLALALAQQQAQEAQAALDQKLAEEAEARRNAASAYADIYPDMYAAPAELESRAPADTVYLTFDDGPSNRTAEVLDILKENDIKATFFVTGQTSEQAKAMMRRIVEEGHTIAVHTYSHQYKQIYASVRAYLDDFYKIYTLVHDVTGVYPQIFRFPGGSVNGYNKSVYKAIVKEMDRRGFVHYDWNALNGDAEGKSYTVEEMAEKALAKVGTSHVIVLMHDSESKNKTVECLPAVIEGYREAGYAFAQLTPEIKSITFD